MKSLMLGLKSLSLRVMEAVLTIALLLTICFFLLHAAPGGPFDAERSLPPEVEAQLQQRFHLNESLAMQYLHYAKNTIRGDLGPSFQYTDYTVNELIAKAAPVTFLMGGLAIVLALILGVSMGALAAWRGGWSDTMLSSMAALGLATPKFILAPLLILLIAVYADWLPAGGWSGDWREAILPVIALALPNLAVVAKLMRAGVLEVMNSEYLQAARSRGIGPRQLFWRHAFKPALMPVMAYAAPLGISVFSGSTVVETVFGIPGLGKYFVQGALNRDYTLVLGVALVIGVVIVVMGLLVDMLRTSMDPRLRASGE